MKTVLITGASSGFGKSTAELLASKGYRLVLAARREERLEDLKQVLSKETDVHIIRLDVCNRDEVKKSLEELPGDFKKIDVLVNNAGLALGLTPAHQANLDDWETMVNTNIKGLMYCTRQLLPGMVERKTGHVINIGSIAGNWPYPGGNTYGATKAFVKQFSNNLRADLHGTGVRITNIEPGLAETEFSLVRLKGDKEKADGIYKGTCPLTGTDIAETVLWAMNRPDHVNISSIEVMPTCQSFAPLPVFKEQAQK